MRLDDFPVRQVVDGRTVGKTPPKTKARWREYYQKNLERRRAYFRARRAKHRDELNAYHRAWRARNKGRQHVYNVKARAKRREAFRAYYWKNRERMLEKNRAYRLKNLERIRAQQRAAYRAKRGEASRRSAARSAELVHELRGGLAAPPPQRNAAELRARPLTPTQFLIGTNP